MTLSNQDVDRYIAQFGDEIQKRLQRMRALVRAASPDAVESISYGLIAYKRNGRPFVYFGGFAKHIGLYATPNSHEAFTEEFSKYKQGKGSVQFPHDQPLPVELIKRVVMYRKQQTSK